MRADRPASKPIVWVMASWGRAAAQAPEHGHEGVHEPADVMRDDAFDLRGKFIFSVYSTTHNTHTTHDSFLSTGCNNIHGYVLVYR